MASRLDVEESSVYLAEPGDAREHELATAGVLQGVLTEEEIDVVVHVEWPDELRICTHMITTIVRKINNVNNAFSSNIKYVLNVWNNYTYYVHHYHIRRNCVTD